MIHIAVDIGASSGRLVIGKLSEDKLMIEEIHRFSNGFTEKNRTLYWDVEHLLHEILVGLERVKEVGHDQCTIGIDTWAVDYVLLNKQGDKLKEVVSYRDDRTENSIAAVTESISKEKIYDITGIQFLPFNTIYQLYEESKEILKETDKILMVPDYLNYRLTGKVKMETTNASTTQLLDSSSRDFSKPLLDVIGVDKILFAPLVDPGYELGTLKNEWFPEFDLPKCQIINVASHDTASAVVGTPSIADAWAYLSSGTWSLFGIETDQPVMGSEALQANYTNEWGAFGTYRFLKNIMGMWVIQEVKKELSEACSYAELVSEASKIEPFQQYIDLNDERFLNPDHMIIEIQNYCRETNQTVPKSTGELAAAVYNNLAIIYALEMDTLESMTKQHIDQLYIVGGGGQNDLLNQLTADLTDKLVFIGPSETTAIGNVLMQLITMGTIRNLQEGRQIVADSFGLKTFKPQKIDRQKIICEFEQITRNR